MNPPRGKSSANADDVVWLTIDKPGTSANVLSSGVLRELDALLQPLTKNPPRALAVISGKKSGFVAGADIKEFTGITNAEEGYRLIHAGQQVLDRSKRSLARPLRRFTGSHWVAASSSPSACRYRVAVGDERLSLGFPEVQLGIHPGFGGTVRSVRLVGVRPAMEMMLTGRPVRAVKAACKSAWSTSSLTAEDLRSAASRSRCALRRRAALPSASAF